VQAAFQEHWFKEVGETLSGKGQFPELGPAGNLQAQVIASHSFSAAPLSLVQAVSFSAAQKSIYITNAYCAPSASQTRSLIAAVKRGVDVQLLLPGKHNDQPATKAAGRTAYGELLKGGVKIYEFQPTMIHSKTMVVDGIFSVFGSSNFDARSARLMRSLTYPSMMKPLGARCRLFSNAIFSAQSDTRSKISRNAHFGSASRNG
jgi:cardiolipin synthase A/B